MVFPMPANDDPNAAIRKLAEQMLAGVKAMMPSNPCSSSIVDFMTVESIWDDAYLAYLKGARASE